MVAYTKLKQRKEEESEKLRGERDQIKLIDLGFERWQVVGFSFKRIKESFEPTEQKSRTKRCQ